MEPSLEIQPSIFEDMLPYDEAHLTPQQPNDGISVHSKHPPSALAVHSILPRRESVMQRQFLETIEHTSDAQRVWWLFTTLCALATSIFTPWEIAFTEKPGLSPYGDAPAITEYFLTTVFVIDIIVNINRAFVYKNRNLESKQDAGVQRYSYLMFWIDLLGVIPFNLILDIFMKFGSNSRILALFRLFRLVRAHRLWALFRDFEVNTHFHLMTTTLVRNLTIVFLVTHCAGCAFYYIAREYGFDDDTWIGANLDLISSDDPNKEDISSDGWKKYVYSIYWSITTMTTVGYGDYSPKNIAEVIFAIIFMLFNIALNSYILGTITLVVIRADEITSQQRRGYEKLETFAKTTHLSYATFTTIREHLRFSYLNRGSKDAELMDLLPSNVRCKIRNEMYGKGLSKCPVFQNCSTRFISALLKSDANHPPIEVEVYMPGDDIIIAGDHVCALSFLLSGKAVKNQQFLDAADKLLALDAYFTPNAQGLHFASSTVTAASTCRVLLIPFYLLDQAGKLYPAQMHLVRSSYEQSHNTHTNGTVCGV